MLFAVAVIFRCFYDFKSAIASSIDPILIGFWYFEIFEILVFWCARGGTVRKAATTLKRV
jgi:hypothetical protein